MVVCLCELRHMICVRQLHGTSTATDGALSTVHLAAAWCRNKSAFGGFCLLQPFLFMLSFESVQSIMAAAFSSAPAALSSSVSLRTRDGARDGKVDEGGAEFGLLLAMPDLL